MQFIRHHRLPLRARLRAFLRKCCVLLQLPFRRGNLSSPSFAFLVAHRLIPGPRNQIIRVRRQTARNSAPGALRILHSRQNRIHPFDVASQPRPVVRPFQEIRLVVILPTAPRLVDRFENVRQCIIFTAVIRCDVCRASPAVHLAHGRFQLRPAQSPVLLQGIQDGVLPALRPGHFRGEPVRRLLGGRGCLLKRLEMIVRNLALGQSRLRFRQRRFVARLDTLREGREPFPLRRQLRLICRASQRSSQWINWPSNISGWSLGCIALTFLLPQLRFKLIQRVHFRPEHICHCRQWLGLVPFRNRPRLRLLLIGLRHRARTRQILLRPRQGCQARPDLLLLRSRIGNGTGSLRVGWCRRFRPG